MSMEHKTADITNHGRQSLLPILKSWVSGLTRYLSNVARHRTLLFWPGSPLTVGKATRVRISADKLDHLLTFVTSI